MRAVIIGGTGHIGGHLTPMLVREGFEVCIISRGETQFPSGDGWKKVTTARISYKQSPEKWRSDLQSVLRDGDTLIDILGSDLASTFDAAATRCSHVIACGSVWMLGMIKRVPFVESPGTEFWDAGYRNRWRVIQSTLAKSLSGGPVFTAILPPNISGPGKIPLDTQGGRSIDVHRALSRGEEVILPEGADILIGPCDAYDVAAAFYLATLKPQRAAGQIFNVGSSYALTASEFIATYAQIYGVKIPVRRVPWQEFATRIVPDPGARFHYESHMCPDISKLRERLGYEPRFTPEQSLWRAVEWMRQQKLI